MQETEQRLTLRLDDEPNGGALLIVNVDIDKRRNTYNMNIFFGQITLGDHDGFHGLIDSAGANGLDLSMARFAHDPGNRAGHGRRPRARRHLNNIQTLRPIAISTMNQFLGYDAFYHG